MLIKFHVQTILKTKQHQFSTKTLVKNKLLNEINEVLTRKQFFVVIISSKIKRLIINITSKQLRSRLIKTTINQSLKIIKKSLKFAVNVNNLLTLIIVKNIETKRIFSLNELKDNIKLIASNKNFKFFNTNIKNFKILTTQKQIAFIKNLLKLNVAYVTLKINFQLINDFIYHIKKNTTRFCIFANCIQNIF